MKNAEKDMTATVTLAMDVNECTKEKISAFCKSKGAESVLYTIDSSLIGGLIVQIDDMIFDGSVRSRLDAIKNSF